MSEPDTTVRPGREADAARIALFNLRMAVETESLRLDPTTVERGVKAALADAAKGRYLVAERGGEVVGCLMLTREWSDWRNGELSWVQSVYVDPEHRRRGVMRALFAAAEQSARDAGAVGVRLYVERENAAAQAVYRSLGMGETHYLVMEKALGE